jgi:DNA (cytosine-5)-methyltransferase 1
MELKKNNEIKYFSMFTGVGGFELGFKRANDNKETGRCGQEKSISKQGSRNISSKSNKRQYSSNDREQIGRCIYENGGWVIKFEDNPKFKPIGFSEIDKYASELLKQKFPTIKNWGDATKINPSELPDFDMLCGGFPCQAFSIAGKRKGFSDTRGTLFFDIARILEVKRPKIVLLENVKGLLNHEKGETFSVILQTLDELGYDVQWMVLNSKFFGVPQNRERVFIIGSLRGECRPEILPFGGSTSKTNINIKRTQSDVSGKGYTSQQDRVYNTDGVMGCLPNANPDNKLNIITPKIVASRGRNPSNPSDRKTGSPTEQRLEVNSEGICNNLTSVQKDHMVLENMKIRRLTPIECERLQGFPDNWTEGFSDTQRYKMMGNAITVNVIKAIGERLIVTIGGSE